MEIIRPCNTIYRSNGVYMREPLVSAVVITHNRLSMLKKAIDSVLAQTYKKIELIVVDDASDDGTYEYFSENQDMKLTYIRIMPEDSKGGNYARNRGIEVAKGELIALLDDDDEWLPTKIEKQVDCMMSSDDISFVGCGIFYEYESGKRHYFNPDDLPEGDLSEYIFYNMPYLSSTMLVRKTALIDIGMFDEDLPCWQDYEMEIRLFQRVKVGTVRENLVSYRVFKSDKHRLTNKLKLWEDTVEHINKKHESLIKKLPPEIKKKRELMIIMDGAMRAENSGDKKRVRYYLAKSLSMEPSAKNMLKYILGVYSFKNNLLG
jgi:glycosyltransferase involved in cell wall biosynthesis